MKSSKRCKGPCERSLKINDTNFRPRPDSRDGYTHKCRDCESALAGLRRAGVSGKAHKIDPGKQPLKRAFPRAKVYVITYAQNATPIHQPFFDSLLTYCNARSAELVVIPGRYKNPTSIWSDRNRTDEWWDPKTHPYLFAGRKVIGEHLAIIGDISIQPTAERPLRGFEVFAGQHSAIFGHPKVQLKTIPSEKRYYPRILTTTGACTKPNYTSSKAGKKAEAHHVYGALIVEQGAKLFHVRQVEGTKDGSFIDLDKEYTPTEVRPAPRPLGLVCGDIHVERSDDAVLRATFTGATSIVRTLRPRTLVFHDVLDFERRNHHTINDFFSRYARVHNPSAIKDSVSEEVLAAVRFLDEIAPEGVNTVVVQSNHDEAFDRWLREADFRRDPVNARFFVDTLSLKLREFDKTGKWATAFSLVYRKHGSGRARFLDREEALKIGDWVCNFHGDKGLNGASGSIQTYAALGIKTIIGHSHSPGILDGCVQVGVTGRLDQDYNDMPSSWLNSHALIYANGKCSILNVIDGYWRGM